MPRLRFVVGVMVALFGATMMSAGVQGQPTGGLYTTAQAERGRVLFDEQCQSCHGALGDFTPGMAALLGDHTFRSRWTGRPLGELFGLVIETMPQDAPGTLSADETTDLLAYVLSGHRFPAGEMPLANNIDTLMELSFTR